MNVGITLWRRRIGGIVPNYQHHATTVSQVPPSRAHRAEGVGKHNPALAAPHLPLLAGHCLRKECVEPDLRKVWRLSRSDPEAFVDFHRLQDKPPSIFIGSSTQDHIPGPALILVRFYEGIPH